MPGESAGELREECSPREEEWIEGHLFWVVQQLPHWRRRTVDLASQKKKQLCRRSDGISFLAPQLRVYRLKGHRAKLARVSRSGITFARSEASSRTDRIRL